MRRALRPVVARAAQVLGLAVAVLLFVALAGPTLEVGTDVGDRADAGPPQQVAATPPPGPDAVGGTGSGGTGTGEVVLLPADGVALVDQTDWLDDGEAFELRLAVGEDVAPSDAVVIDLHAPVTSRSQFSETLEGRLLGSRRAEFVIPLAELPPAADGSRVVRLVAGPAERPGERTLGALPRAGVYPLVVGVRPDAPEQAPAPPFTTYLVRTPESATTPLRVAVVQPVRSPLAIRPDGTADLGSPELERLAGVAGVLAGSVGTPLTITPRPETLEALRLVAASGEGPGAAVATAVLDDLRSATAGRQVVSGPFVDVVLDALTAAGLGDEVATQRRRGDEAVEQAIGATTDVRTWVADEGVAPRSLRRLAGLGVDHLVVPDASLSPVDLRLSLTRPFAVALDGGATQLEATAPDPALSARFATADPVLGAQHVIADLAVLHGDEPGTAHPRGVVVAPPEDVHTDPLLLEGVLDGLFASPILEPVTLDTYFEQVVPEGAGGEPLVRDLTPAEGRLGISAGEVEAARVRLQALLGTVDADRPETARLTDLVLLAQADGLTPSERRTYLAAASDRLSEEMGSVRILDRASFRLPDSEGTIPLTVVREGDEPLSVRVVLASDKLQFEDAPSTAANQISYDLDLTSENTPLVVPVRVRSPGSFPLLVTVTSPDGRVELLRSQVTVHSTAFSGVGLALSAGAGLFLLLWWTRHWRTVRRARRLVPAR